MSVKAKKELDADIAHGITFPAAYQKTKEAPPPVTPKRKRPKPSGGYELPWSTPKKKKAKITIEISSAKSLNGRMGGGGLEGGDLALGKH